MNRTCTRIACVALVLCVGGLAQAVTITASDTVNTTGSDNSGAETNWADATHNYNLASNTVCGMSWPGVTGTLKTVYYDNNGAPAHYGFAFSLELSSGSDPVNIIAMNDYTCSSCGSLDVDWDSQTMGGSGGGGTASPDNCARSASPGSWLNWTFSTTPITAGTTSKWLHVNTDSTMTPGGGSTITITGANGSCTVTTGGFSPT
jgi:hypothetical protein